MSYKDLNRQIKNSQINNLYLFFGPEQYLIKHSVNQIKEKLISHGFEQLNYLLLQEDSATTQSIIEFCDSFPVMADKKLIVIKDFGLLSSKKSKSSEDDKDRLVKYLSDLPQYVHIVFWEEDVNKKGGFYKFLQKSASIVEFEQLNKSELSDWVVKFLKGNGKTTDLNTAGYMIDILETDMQMLKNECLKLISYVGDRKDITINDINIACQKTLKHKIFEMIDDIAQKNVQGAISKLKDILSLKEPEIKILGLIIWNIKTLFKVKLALNEGIPRDALSRRLDIKFISKYLSQSQNFTLDNLQEALIKCSQADVEMKTKGLDNQIALEKLIIQIAR